MGGCCRMQPIRPKRRAANKRNTPYTKEEDERPREEEEDPFPRSDARFGGAKLGWGWDPLIPKPRDEEEDPNPHFDAKKLTKEEKRRNAGHRQNLGSCEEVLQSLEDWENTANSPNDRGTKDV